ncbi:hypothetical protein OXH18_20560 [Thermocoleostomius sinensis A174]|uniref:Uncharacterized protein n=1 Tax=Thermocoleostomius sinensis A174 TaxID=2016057 RepID=A0A9E9C6R5_9CYAN|nr:hypothetical protein OXH18_20560 [Thermocoleostomius sinensis A174]
MRVSYYVVYDSAQQLGNSPPLRLYKLRGLHHTELTEPWLEQVNLGFRLWQGEFEGRRDTWLRWCDEKGNILLTGDEKTEQERQRADRLAEMLRAQGIDPDQLSS